MIAIAIVVLFLLVVAWFFWRNYSLGELRIGSSGEDFFELLVFFMGVFIFSIVIYIFLYIYDLIFVKNYDDIVNGVVWFFEFSFLAVFFGFSIFFVCYGIIGSFNFIITTKEKYKKSSQKLKYEKEKIFQEENKVKNEISDIKAKSFSLIKEINMIDASIKHVKNKNKYLEREIEELDHALADLNIYNDDFLYRYKAVVKYIKQTHEKGRAIQC